MVTPARLKDIAKDIDFDGATDRKAFFEKLNSAMPEIQAAYVKKVFSLLDEADVSKKVADLGSDIEPLGFFDENDKPLLGNDGWWITEFRKDFGNISVIPESVEQSLFIRIVVFILEDSDGKIVVSRRSQKKSHAGEWAIAGGHVTAGDSYLETVYRELAEELNFVADPGSITEADRLFKYRNFIPGDAISKGKGYLLSVYRVCIPNRNLLAHDPEEIDKLLLLSPNELYEAIVTGSLGGEEFVFSKHHAYWYLEYLESVRGISTSAARKEMEMAGDMKNRTKIETFALGE